MKGRDGKRKWIWTAMLVCVAVSPAWAARGAGRSSITARAAILVDNQTGEVLWERNADTALPPASTTKVLTAMVALRSGRLDDSMRVSVDAAKEPPSKIHLRAGWRLRLLDLIYAILLNSANDASVVIAEGLAGSVPAFADLMNAQAERLGATNSHFVNPNGLPAADHYSTARDLATLFSVAVRDPVFDRIVSTQSIPIIPTEGAVRAINLRSHNRLLNANLPYEVVGKTGWTIAAKRCFVGAARANGRELIVAVLGARDLWGDVRKLVEFGLEGRGLPEVEMARADVEEVSSISRAAGDDGDDEDAATYSGRVARDLRATRRNPSARVSRSSAARQSAARAQAFGGERKPSKRRAGKSNLARASQAQNANKVVRRTTRGGTVARSRAVAAKAPVTKKAKAARAPERKIASSKSSKSSKKSKPRH